MTNAKYKTVTLAFSSVVATGTTMNGDYLGKTNLLVEGLITGDVKVKGVVMVGVGGSVKGKVEGEYVVVAGKVGGDVSATSGAEVKPTGDVGGGVFAKELLIHATGKVHGDIGAGRKHFVSYEPRTLAE